MMGETTVQHVTSLADAVRTLIKNHMESMKKNEIVNLRELLLEQVEPILLEITMLHCRYNQSQTAKVLGISRGTCRQLLIKYFNDKYCGNRGEYE